MTTIIGIDDSNYSPSLAGPCVVAAYILRPTRVTLPTNIKDSKIITSQARVELFNQLSQTGHYVISLAMPSDIERFGVYRARNQAAAEAVRRIMLSLPKRLRTNKTELHADESLAKPFSSDFDPFLDVKSITGGDEWVWAASICAKVTADALFYGFAALYPEYAPNFSKGLIKPHDKELLMTIGPTPFHRRRGYANN